MKLWLISIFKFLVIIASFFVMAEIISFVMFSISGIKASGPKYEVILAARELQVIPQKNLIWDPTLGVRHLPLHDTHSLIANGRGEPMAGPKYFVDRYGFISNSSDQKNDYDLEDAVNDESCFRILIVGASTSFWGADTNTRTYPAILQGILNDKGDLPKNFRRVLVVNSSTVGSLISQQLRRFIDETYFLRPHMIIHFMGPRRLSDFEKVSPANYSMNTSQKRIFYKMNRNPLARQLSIFPNLWKLLDVLMGQTKVDPMTSLNSEYNRMRVADLFMSKIRQFYDLSRGAGSKYIWFLPPILAQTQKKLTPKEEKLKKYFGKTFYSVKWEDYNENIARNYHEIRSQITDTSWQVDLTGLFDNEKKNIFVDPQHFNNSGHELVAKKIFDYIERNFSTK